MFGLRLSSVATSRFLWPATTSSTICRSVSDSSLSEAVRPLIRRSSARALVAHRRAPNAETPGRQFEGVAGVALALCPPLHRTER